MSVYVFAFMHMPRFLYLWMTFEKLWHNCSRRVEVLFERFIQVGQRSRSCRLNPGQILDSSKLREFADDNFKRDKNGGNFTK